MRSTDGDPPILVKVERPSFEKHFPWKLTIEGFREGAWIHSNELEVIEMIKGWREEV